MALLAGYSGGCLFGGAIGGLCVWHEIGGFALAAVASREPLSAGFRPVRRTVGLVREADVSLSLEERNRRFGDVRFGRLVGEHEGHAFEQVEEAWDLGTVFLVRGPAAVAAGRWELGIEPGEEPLDE